MSAVGPADMNAAQAQARTNLEQLGEPIRQYRDALTISRLAIEGALQIVRALDDRSDAGVLALRRGDILVSRLRSATDALEAPVEV
jgi:hypothetical protein